MDKFKEFTNKVEVKKKEKMNKILDTSFSLFTEKGINDTTVQDIVSKAGLAKGTFYLYFKDKYELQNELIVRKSKILFDNAINALDKKKIKKFDDQIIFIIDHIIDELSHNVLLVKFITKNLSWGVYNDKLSILVDKNTFGIKELFEQRIKENNIKLDNPKVMLYMIIELVSSTCYTSIVNKEPLPINEFKPFLYQTIKKMINE